MLEMLSVMIGGLLFVLLLFGFYTVDPAYWVQFFSNVQRVVWCF